MSACTWSMFLNMCGTMCTSSHTYIPLWYVTCKIAWACLELAVCSQPDWSSSVICFFSISITSSLFRSLIGELNPTLHTCITLRFENWRHTKMPFAFWLTSSAASRHQKRQRRPSPPSKLPTVTWWPLNFPYVSLSWCMSVLTLHSQD